jgi:hypothetical protein
MAAMFVKRSGQMSNVYRNPFHICFIPSFGSFDQAVTEEKIFFFIKLTNQTQELHMLAMSVNGSGRNKQPSIDSSYQVSVHLAKQFQMRRLKCVKLTDDR